MINNMIGLSQIDQIRIKVSNGLDPKQKVQLGQFLTPDAIAHYMASLFPQGNEDSAYLLDAGAGVGSLSNAFLQRWNAHGFSFKNIDVTAYEIDTTLRKYLDKSLSVYTNTSCCEVNVFEKDFIEDAAHMIAFGTGSRFTHAILNPPYRKINSNSRHRQLLRQVGIETVNLYSAFVALSIALMRPGGHIVAIIPRSFCNGPYYRSFREYLFKKAALKHIHLFSSRDKVFKDDSVLQENVIILLECTAHQGPVTISTSADDHFTDYHLEEHQFSEIVNPNDQEKFIHIPITSNGLRATNSLPFNNTLADLNIDVSTGPVVDFRVEQFITDMPTSRSVPLLYPCHFGEKTIEWPKQSCKKPNAITLAPETIKWLYPKGYYTMTRRFSSKEEKRRIVANVITPGISNSKYIGFENHLNVFHCAKKGLSESIAYGLAVYLNSTLIDEYFRKFSGHTQVNVADLKQLKYPNSRLLNKLGQWAVKQARFTQESIDNKIKEII
jgi:tRNA1(Val) A37 N6-methylase TrmN6